ncbi:MAG: hypothetical protein ABIO43_01630 [Sphingomicrobium sp.]
MARHDGELKAGREIDLADVFSAGELRDVDPRRREAIACYLSGSEGWREAIAMLGGAFASQEHQPKSRLTDGKAD